jgi:hypothetical protein
MTLIFFDGLQDATTTPKPEWDTIVGTWNGVAAGRDGSTNGCARLSGAAGSGFAARKLNLPSSATTCIVGFAFQVNGAHGVSANEHIIGFQRGATFEAFLTCNATTNLWELRIGANSAVAVTATGTAALPFNEWHYIQVKITLSSTAGSCIVRQDGVEILNFSGVTSTVTGAVTAIQMSRDSNNDTYYDDLWVCDGVDATSTQGRTNNDFLGDLKVATLLPSATVNGSSTQWTKSTGTIAGALVDEVPPNTTDYIFSSTSGQRELMPIADLAATASAVYGLRIGVYALTSDAGAQSIKTVVKESGGTITAQAAKALSATAAPYYGAYLFTKPSAPTTPWTVADVNGIEAGVDLV